VRHPERLLGRGSVALPSAILRLLRALSPAEVACVVSILLRLRYAAPAPTGSVAAGPAAAESAAASDSAASGLPASLLDTNGYKDCQELAAGASRASQEAFAQLAALSPDRVSELADSLLLAQPQLCTAFLLDRGFLQGQVPTDSAARRVVRSIHAVHRESLVVYPA